MGFSFIISKTGKRKEAENTGILLYNIFSTYLTLIHKANDNNSQVYLITQIINPRDIGLNSLIFFISSTPTAVPGKAYGEVNETTTK